MTMGGYQIFSGSNFSLYYAPVATAATAINRATGIYTPVSPWQELGSGDYVQDITVDNQDTRQEIMTAGGRGMPAAERRIARGLMITGGLWDASQEVFEETWGNDISVTSPSAGMVGVKKINLDLGLNVPEVAVQIIFSSSYGRGDAASYWNGLVYLPKATLMLGETPFAIEPTPTPFTVKQLVHTTQGYREEVSAPAA